MRAASGGNATRVYLLLVSALALPAVAIFLLVLLSAASQDAEGLWLLALAITAPIWLLGIVAVVEVARVVRGGRVSRRRAIAFALVAIVGGAVLAWTQGVLAFAATLVDRPGDVDLGWPVSIVWAPDRSGADHVHLDAAGIWLAVAWITLGAVSLAASVRDRRSDRTSPGAIPDPSDAPS